MEKHREGFSLLVYAGFFIATVLVGIVCVCVGSVTVPLGDTWSAVWNALKGTSATEGVFDSIILLVRLPRVLCVALSGASLSLCGAAMQGLLRNPLADGSTLGVSSGASLGAMLAIAFGVTIPVIPNGGTMAMAMLFAFCSLVFILSLAYRLDHSLATNTIILIGVIFTMFAHSIISLVIAFSGDRVKSVMFWTMGALAGSRYENVWALLVVFALCGTLLFTSARELNAFAIGEDNARHIGVDVKRVKLKVLISASALIGVCVSIGGNIGFVGLVMPHMMRMLVGPNHKRLLPASAFGGAIFLLLMDLVGRVVLRPLEVPIGVITSLIGSVTFVYLFYSMRKAKK